MDWKLGPADTWVRMEVFLRELLTRVSPLPRVLLVVSAHWESDPIAITASADPALRYDYYGFPEHTYALRYPVPGAPGLAAELKSASGRDHVLGQARIMSQTRIWALMPFWMTPR